MLTRRKCLLSLPMIPIAACRKAAAPVPVHVVAMPYLYMASLYLADELGHFAKEGLHVDIEQMEGSTVTIPVLAGGKADAAFFGIHPALINAVARGARIRIVAGRQFYSTDCPFFPPVIRISSRVSEWLHRSQPDQRKDRERGQEQERDDRVRFVSSRGGRETHRR